MDKKIDGKAVREALKSFWTGQSALFGSLAKVPGTPSEQIAAITKLKDDADANLAGLPAEDAVVETELAGFLNRVQTHCALLTAQIQGNTTQLAGSLTEITTLKADRVARDQVKSLEEVAFAKGVASVMPAVVAMRKLAITDLPEPEAAILELPADQFKIRLELARKNLAALAQKGATLAGKGAAFVKAVVWQDEKQFAGSLEMISDFAAPPVIDPLKGGVDDKKPTGSLHALI